MATGAQQGGRVTLARLERFESLPAFGAWLAQPQAWVGGFDFPFGLPRELVAHLGWPQQWAACMDHYAALSRPAIRDTFAAFCDARPVGGKFAHRATDRPAGSSPSMKWVNPPVAWMMHAGVPRLLAVGAWLPAHQPDPGRTASGAGRMALEAYPGLLARELLGGSTSYKSDDPARQTPERQQARRHMLDALAAGHTRLDLRLELTPAQAEALVADASGDALDAVLCLVQVAWAGQRGAYGLPDHVDPLEGWITSA